MLLDTPPVLGTIWLGTPLSGGREWVRRGARRPPPPPTRSTPLGAPTAQGERQIIVPFLIQTSQIQGVSRLVTDQTFPSSNKRKNVFIARVFLKKFLYKRELSGFLIPGNIAYYCNSMEYWLWKSQNKSKDKWKFKIWSSLNVRYESHLTLNITDFTFLGFIISLYSKWYLWKVEINTN